MTTATRAAPRTDQAEIIRALDIILAPGDVLELRALDATTADDRRPHIESGYFDSAGALAKAVATIRTAKGIYITINPVDPALLARAANRIRPAGKNPLTSDHDIIGRHWLPIDIDPPRPAGISATAQEHYAAEAVAREMADHLAADGWPDGILADSGNGWHLLYRLDLPADDGGLVQRVLAAMHARWPMVDVTTHNPARIWKLYGTRACKGDDTPDRPHRMARIVEIPPHSLCPVPVDILEATAGPAPEATRASNGNGNGHHHHGQQFDLRAWLANHSIAIGVEKPFDGGWRAELERCPWSTAHTDGAFIGQRADGAIVASCRHSSCAGRRWQDLRELHEPGYRDQRESHHHEKEPQGTAERNATFRPSTYTDVDLLTTELPEPKWAVDGILPVGVTLLVASPKIGKTWLMLGCATAIAAGGRALGQILISQPGDVLYLALEDNRRRMKSRMEKLTAADAQTWNAKPYRIEWAHQWPRLDEGGVRAIDDWLTAHPDTRLVVIDTLKKIRPRRRRNGNAYDEDYEAVEPLVEIAERHGVSIVFVHHTRKAKADDVLDEVSGTHGLSGAADTILVLQRARGKAKAILHVTGRDVEEQELALGWDKQYCQWVMLGDAAEHAGNELRGAILATLKAATQPMSPAQIAEAMGRCDSCDKSNIRQSLFRMAQAGQIETVGRGKYTVIFPDF